MIVFGKLMMPSILWIVDDTRFFSLDSEKNLPGLETLYRTFPNADWYIMIDDDTFIFLDNLARFLLEQSSGISSPQDVPLYFGNPFSVVIPLSEDDSSTGT